MTATVQDPQATVGTIALTPYVSYEFVVGTYTNAKPILIGQRGGHKRVVAERRNSVLTVSHPDGFPPHYVRVSENHGDTWYEVCKKCDGEGYYPSSLYNGICFTCNGWGTYAQVTMEQMTQTLTKWGERAKRISDKTQARIDARTRQREAWIAEHADLIAWARSLTPDDVTVEKERSWDGDLVEITHEFFNTTFSGRAARMITDVREGHDLDLGDTRFLYGVWRKKNADDAAPIVGRNAGTPKQRMEITGRIVIRSIQDQNRYNNTPYLIVVEGIGDDAGIRWSMFHTGSQKWEVAVGDTVKVKATIKENRMYRKRREDLVNRAVFTILEKAAVEE